MGTPARYYSSTAVRTTLTASAFSTDTEINVASTTNFPAQYPYTLILEKDSANEEVVVVTGVVGTALVVTRGFDGTAARAHSVGTSVEHGVSARDFTDFRTHEAASNGVHDIGSGSSVVGTATTQTLTNKTLTSPAVNTPTITGGTITNATVTNPTFTGDIKAPAAFGVEFEGTTDDAFETRLIASGPTADRVVSLPDASTTLVGRDTTDTLTNKTVSGSTLSGTTTNTGTISGGTVADATLTNASLSNDLNANSKKITGLAAPSASTDAANKTYVDTSVANIVDSAPAALNTLNELAEALGDDPNFATTVTNSIAAKVVKSGDTMTGNLTMSSGAKVTGLPTPTVSGDAVPLDYVTTLYGSTASAATSAAAASTSASAAAASATAASGSATSASNSATSATASAATATTQATSSTASAAVAVASKDISVAIQDELETNFGDGRAPVFLMMGG